LPVDGKYKIVIKTPLGDVDNILILKSDGNSLSGSIINAMNSNAEFAGGDLDGDTFIFTVRMNSPIGSLKSTLSGKVDGNSIAGIAKIMFGSAPFSGARV
jgi:hypothetical protein